MDRSVATPLAPLNVVAMWASRSIKTTDSVMVRTHYFYS